MPATRRIGIGLTALSASGDATGVAAPYPGRAASSVGVVVGVALRAIGDGPGEGAVRRREVRRRGRTPV